MSTPKSRLRIGDRVRVDAVQYAAESRFIGKVGTITDFGFNGNPLVKEHPAEHSHPDRVFTYASEVTLESEIATPAVEVLVDIKRLQAAKAATELLPDSLLDDQLRLAAFILAEPTAELVAAEATPAAAPTTETFWVNDTDGDTLEVIHRGHDLRQPVSIVTQNRNGRNRSAVYLTRDDVESVIERLQGFLADAATVTPF